MSFNKSERILNLFFVLLNAKRPVSRSEIRGKVAGYEDCDSDGAFERMFERDKDEIRNIGIKIDTLPIDPLFDDELGYQIDQTIFLTRSINWSVEEKSVLNVASSIWHKTEFESLAKTATLKTGSSKKVNETKSDLSNASDLEIYRKILLGLNSNSILNFNYLSNDDETPRPRKVIARKLYRRGDSWYLEATDMQDSNIKNYQINRVFGEVTNNPASEIEIKLSRKEDSVQSANKDVVVRFDQNAYLLSHKTGGQVLNDSDIRFEYHDDESFVKYLLTLSSIVVNIGDKTLSELYLDNLKSFKKVLM